MATIGGAMHACQKYKTLISSGIYTFNINVTGAIEGGGAGAVVSIADYGQRVPGSRPGQVAVRRSLEQVIFTLLWYI